MQSSGENSKHDYRYDQLKKWILDIDKENKFDIYGKWVKSLLLDNFQAMIYLDKIIYYKADNKIYSHNTELPMLGDTVLWEAGNVYSICYDAREICFYGINSTGEIVKLNVR